MALKCLLICPLLWLLAIPLPLFGKIYSGNPELQIFAEKYNQLEADMASLKKEVVTLKNFLHASQSTYEYRHFHGSMDGIFNHLALGGGSFELVSVNGNPYYAKGRFAFNDREFLLDIQFWDETTLKGGGSLQIQGPNGLKIHFMDHGELVRTALLSDMHLIKDRELFYTDERGRQFLWKRLRKASPVDPVRF